MRQPANFTSPVSAAMRHVDYFRVARHSGGIATTVATVGWPIQWVAILEAVTPRRG